MSRAGTELNIKGYTKNVCKKCGEEFELPYFEDETPEVAKKDYCVACVFGFKNHEEFVMALKKSVSKG